MKIFKTIITSVVVVFILAIILMIISIPLINNFQAYKVKKELLNIALPEKTEIVESLSKAGKLSGNGNGMQYFGAMLIRSDLPFEDLETYYAKYAENGWDGPFVEKPNGQVFDVTNWPIRFSASIDSQNYYIVYLWGGKSSVFLDFDIRGH